jgi:hypothetical protein
MERVDQPLADYAAPLGVSCPCALTILIGFRMRSACSQVRASERAIIWDQRRRE